MEIKISKDNRLRLSQEEKDKLLQDGQIAQTFVISDKNKILIEFTVSNVEENSKMATDVDMVSFIISKNDFDNLCADKSKNASVQIENFKIEIDQWTEEKRKKVKALNDSRL